jgi:hypothetical protein
MLNFEQFVASRKEVPDLGAELGLDDMNGIAGYVHKEDYIEKDDDEFMLIVENQRSLDADLSKLECILYDVWYVPQNSDAEDEPAHKEKHDAQF